MFFFLQENGPQLPICNYAFILMYNCFVKMFLQNEIFQVFGHISRLLVFVYYILFTDKKIIHTVGCKRTKV